MPTTSRRNRRRRPVRANRRNRPVTTQDRRTITQAAATGRGQHRHSVTHGTNWGSIEGQGSGEPHSHGIRMGGTHTQGHAYQGSSHSHVTTAAGQEGHWSESEMTGDIPQWVTTGHTHPISDGWHGSDHDLQGRHSHNIGTAGANPHTHGHHPQGPGGRHNHRAGPIARKGGKVRNKRQMGGRTSCPPGQHMMPDGTCMQGAYHGAPGTPGYKRGGKVRGRKMVKGGRVNTKNTRKFQHGGSTGGLSSGRNLAKICKNRPKAKKLLDQYGNDMCIGHR